MTTQTQTLIDLIPYVDKYVTVTWPSGHTETGRLYHEHDIFWLECDTRHGLRAHSCPARFVVDIQETSEPLPHRVAVYVPGTNGRELADQLTVRDTVNLVARLLAYYFGGSTTIDGFGNWLDDENNLISEPVKIVYSFTKTLTHADIANVRRLAADVKYNLSQDCVAIEIDSELSFI